MLKKLIVKDERKLQIYHSIGSKTFYLTYCLLLLDMAYRKHILGQNINEDYWDIAAIFIFVCFVYIAANLYYGGILPIRFKQVSLRVYATLITLSLFIGMVSGKITNFKHGFEVFLEASAAVVLLIGLYYIFIYIGKKRHGIDED